MDIMEAATQLGKLIKDSEAYKKLDSVKAEYENCHEIAEYMNEYEADQKALEEIAAKPEPDTHAVDALQERLNQLFKLVTEHPLYVALTEAQERVNELMEQVNNQIAFTVTGKIPCSHDCSSCHADCHH